MDDDLEKRIADLEGRERGINEQNSFEDSEALRRGVLQWIREHWTVVAIGVLSLPFTAVAVYFVVRFIKSRR